MKQIFIIFLIICFCFGCASKPITIEKNERIIERNLTETPQTETTTETPTPETEE